MIYLPICSNFRIQEGPDNSKTKAIIFNNPNNPLGKVFQREEIEEIANLCKKHNVLVISDDVYEHMVFEENEMIRMATLPDMYERTITIGSAGKTFSVTGWKLGWALGPEHLLQNCQVHRKWTFNGLLKFSFTESNIKLIAILFFSSDLGSSSKLRLRLPNTNTGSSGQSL